MVWVLDLFVVIHEKMKRSGSLLYRLTFLWQNWVAVLKSEMKICIPQRFQLRNQYFESFPTWVDFSLVSGHTLEQLLTIPNTQRHLYHFFLLLCPSLSSTEIQLS